jgi:hypothetical protein
MLQDFNRQTHGSAEGQDATGNRSVQHDCDLESRAAYHYAIEPDHRDYATADQQQSPLDPSPSLLHGRSVVIIIALPIILRIMQSPRVIPET